MWSTILWKTQYQGYFDYFCAVCGYLLITDDVSWLRHRWRKKWMKKMNNNKVHFDNLINWVWVQIMESPHIAVLISRMVSGLTLGSCHLPVFSFFSGHDRDLNWVGGASELISYIWNTGRFIPVIHLRELFVAIFTAYLLVNIVQKLLLMRNNALNWAQQAHLIKVRWSCEVRTCYGLI